MGDQPYVNLLDPEFYVDPWDAYRWLRDNDPVFWDPVQKLWGISRFEDVMHVEKHAQLYSSYQGSRPHIDQTENTSMIDQDDPAHQCQRSLIVRRFTPRAVSTQEDEVREVATAIVDAVAPRGSCDAVEAIASRLPAIMIGRRLGYAPDQWEQVRSWSEITMYQGGQTPADGGQFPTREMLGDAVTDFAETTLRLVRERRADPRDDLISIWTQAEREGQGRPWTDQEILEECLLVLDGGAETTRTVIGAIIVELAAAARSASHPRRAARGAGAHRCGGVHPLGVPDPQHAPYRHPGPRAPRQAAPRGRPGAAHVPVGEPR